MRNDPLAQLRDLHLGEPIGAWPLAYGWYLLIGLTLVLFTAFICFVYRAYQHQKPKKEALNALALLEKDYQLNLNANDTAYQITLLLKRVCFAYASREKVASLHSNDWIKFLGSPPWASTLIKLSYQKTHSFDLSPLFPEIKHWINTCKKRLKHV